MSRQLSEFGVRLLTYDHILPLDWVFRSRLACEDAFGNLITECHNVRFLRVVPAYDPSVPLFFVGYSNRFSVDLALVVACFLGQLSRSVDLDPDALNSFV